MAASARTVNLLAVPEVMSNPKGASSAGQIPRRVGFLDPDARFWAWFALQPVTDQRVKNDVCFRGVKVKFISQSHCMPGGEGWNVHSYWTFEDAEVLTIIRLFMNFVWIFQDLVHLMMVCARICSHTGWLKVR